MTNAAMTPEVEKYWREFSNAAGKGGDQPFDVFNIGNSRESADEGLQLILSGTKTTTSCLPEEFADNRPPQAGDYSIVLDGSGKPGAVVETVSVIPTPFNDVDADFAHAYGEWDRTLNTWRANNRGYYQALCKEMGLEWREDRILLCETFRLVHPRNQR